MVDIPKATPPIQRFMRWVRVDSETGCWLWTGHTAGSKTRYAVFNPTTRSTDPKVYAHRWSYEYHLGPIPKGLEVDHLRRHRLCVRPTHLDPVTPEENQRRTRLLVCSRGLHDLTDPANVRWDDQGRRRGCLTCHREQARIRMGAKYVRKTSRRKGRCKRGHLKVGDNLYVYPSGVRACSTCLEADRKGPKTHCKRGHPFDEANTYYKPDGERRCRICYREQKRAARQRRRGGQ